VPAPWTAPRRGFYFVDEAKGSDEKNDYGTPARPRRTIPNLLPAGAVVTVRGKYTRVHSSPNTLEAQGTAAAPVFIIGGSFTRENELSGTYVVVERSASPGWVIRDTRAAGETHHVVVRNVELIGGGIGITTYLGGDVHDIVVLRASIHDVGDMNEKVDIDSHCIAIGPSHHIWVLDSLFARCSGDGIQINGGQNGPKLHHVYVGRNIATHNRQSGFWAKQSTFVVMSSNVVTDMRPGVGGLGNCMGSQYGANGIVFINNRVSDCEYGIGVWSYDDAEPGGVLMVGNVITDIHRTKTSGTAGDPWAGGTAIFTAGGRERVIVNNTIVDVDAAIQAPVSPGTLRAVNNIIIGVKRGAMAFEGDGTKPKVDVTNTLYDAAPSIFSSGASATMDLRALTAGRNLLGAPRFLDPAAGDFRLQPGSPAIAAGAPLAALSDAYRAVHGVPLGLDLTGTPNLGALGSALVPRVPPAKK
jgi:hypothetical protein